MPLVGFLKESELWVCEREMQNFQDQWMVALKDFPYSRFGGISQDFKLIGKVLFRHRGVHFTGCLWFNFISTKALCNLYSTCGQKVPWGASVVPFSVGLGCVLILGFYFYVGLFFILFGFLFLNAFFCGVALTWCWPKFSDHEFWQ